MPSHVAILAGTGLIIAAIALTLTGAAIVGIAALAIGVGLRFFSKKTSEMEQVDIYDGMEFEL